MTTISHRELRNNSGEILRRVEAGESFDVTNHGIVVAVIGPKKKTALEKLRDAGQVREPTRPRSTLSDIEPIRSELTTQEIIDDLRGPRL